MCSSNRRRLQAEHDKARIVRARSGSWVRRGRTIVLLPASHMPVSAANIAERPEGELSSPEAVVQWIRNVAINPYDVIDPRLDVGAQKAILRMARGPARLMADALGMFAGVKSGRLSGIFGDDLARAAQVAARLRTVRWKLVPPGRDAVLLTPPASQPVIIFREGVRSVPSRLDPALRQAFRGLATRAMTASAQKAAVQSVSANPSDPLPAILCGFECALCAAAILDGVPFDEIIPCEICLACASGLN